MADRLYRIGGEEAARRALDRAVIRLPGRSQLRFVRPLPGEDSVTVHRAVDAALAALSVALAPEPGIAALAGLVEALAAPAPLHDEHDEGMETVWLEAEMRGRGLLSHESHGFRKHGLPGSLAWPQKPCSDRGGRLMPTQTVGGSSSGGADALRTRITLDGLAANDSGSGSGVGGPFELSSEARRYESANENTRPEHEVGLRLMARW